MSFLETPQAGEVLNEYVLNDISGATRPDIKEVERQIYHGEALIQDFDLSDNDLRWLLLNGRNQIIAPLIHHIRELVKEQAEAHGYLEEDEGDGPEYAEEEGVIWRKVA